MKILDIICYGPYEVLLRLLSQMTRYILSSLEKHFGLIEILKIGQVLAQQMQTDRVGGHHFILLGHFPTISLGAMCLDLLFVYTKRHTFIYVA